MAASLRVNCNWWPCTTLGGSGWPWSRFSSGFGSNVSIWLGPPCMNRKITCFARPGKCGFLGANGFSRVPAGAADSRPSRPSKSIKAQAPKPNPAERTISPRAIKGGTTGFGWCEQQAMVLVSAVVASIDMHELVGIEQGEAQLGQRVLLEFWRTSAAGHGCGSCAQERQSTFAFRWRSGPAEGQQPG